MKILFTIILSFNVSLVFADKPKDPVVAEVLGKKILLSTLNKYHAQNLKHVQTKKVSKEKSLNDLINRTIGVVEGKKAGIDQKPEVAKRMNDIVYHAYISEELVPLLKKINITDSDIKDYYKKYPEYKTQQILLRVRALPSADEVAQMFDKIQEIYSQVAKDPENFEAYAKKHSQTVNSKNGGNLGFLPRAQMSQEFFEAIHNKKPGTIVKPFRSQYGFHIVKVLEVKEFKDIDLNLYRKFVYDMKKDEILDSYFEKKRKPPR